MTYKIDGIILASGQSKRMGKPKLLLPWKGIALINHVVYQTASIPFQSIKIVIPENNVALQNLLVTFHTEPIYNSCPHQGIGHSISLAIQSLSTTTQAVIIILGDQPAIDANDILNVWNKYQNIPSTESGHPKAIIQVKYKNGTSGHPILFSSHFFNELRALDADIGGKEIIRRNTNFLHYCKSENRYPFDIDTPSDYKKLNNEVD